MTAQQKLIALVDGSLYSASVCEHAAWIAQKTGAPVEVIHVLPQREGAPSDDHSGTIALGARTALLTELAELDAQRARLISQQGRALLDDARTLVERAGGAQVTTRLRHGDIVQTVAETEADAALIVVGKRGEAADFARGHLGSNLERIVRASHRPVFIAARAFKPIARVLVAFDGGASAQKAVDHMAQSPLFRGLAVHLVTVSNVTTEGTNALADAAARLGAVGITAETSVLPGQPETALAALVEQGVADLLVMGAYGHSRIRSLIIGSTTTAMIRACKVPVLLMR